MAQHYEATANEAVDRIGAALPHNEWLLGETDPWKLFKAEGLDLSGLDLTLYQAGWAFAKAKHNYREKQDQPQ